MVSRAASSLNVSRQLRIGCVKLSATGGLRFCMTVTARRDDDDTVDKCVEGIFPFETKWLYDMLKIVVIYKYLVRQGSQGIPAVYFWEAHTPEGCATVKLTRESFLIYHPACASNHTSQKQASQNSRPDPVRS